MKQKTMVFMALAGMVLSGCAQQKKIEQSVPPVIAPAGNLTAASGPAPAVVLNAPAPVSEPKGPSVQVAEAIFCTGVKDRIPKGVSEAFDAGVKKVFFFTRVTGGKTPTSITHVWYWNEKKMAEVPLDVRSDNWRTWSSKRIDPSWRGSWSVKVLDANGEIVSAKDFQIR